MSNPTTHFLVGGIDLSSIFQPYSLGIPYEIPTGYKVNEQDFNQIFAAYPGVGPKANITGYDVSGVDLCDIFAKYNSSQVGIQWTKRNFPNSGYVNGFATAGNYWIVGSNFNVFVSNDGGLSWNTSSFAVNNGNYYGIAGNTDGTLFCMSNSGHYYSSTDGGMNWTNRGNTPNSGVGNAMVYTNNTFVNVFLISATCLGAYSTDGITWHNSTGYNDDSTYWWNLGTDGCGNLIATGYTDNLLSSVTAYSSDSGATWSQGPEITNGDANTYPITYGNGLWIAVASNAPNQTAVSTVFPPIWNYYQNDIYMDAITYCPTQGYFYATSINNGIYKSTNGQNWTNVLSSNDAPISLEYNETQDKFIGVSFSKSYCFTSL